MNARAYPLKGNSHWNKYILRRQQMCWAKPLPWRVVMVRGAIPEGTCENRYIPSGWVPSRYGSGSDGSFCNYEKMRIVPNTLWGMATAWPGVRWLADRFEPGTVGKLICLSLTRPNIGFAVSVVSQLKYSPTQQHLDTVNHILKFLKRNPSKGLMFRKTEQKWIESFVDVWLGWSSRRQKVHYCTKVWGNLVT